MNNDSLPNVLRVDTSVHSLDTPGIGGVWMRFWFRPTDSFPLSLVRIGTAILGLFLLWSFVSELQLWFSSDGLLPPEEVINWRSSFGFSLLDYITSTTSIYVFFFTLTVTFILLMMGVFSSVMAITAAILWASLLNRVPMLAGPADDCVSVLLWCLAVGPSGDYLSVDRQIRTSRGDSSVEPSWRARCSLGLLQVHAGAICLGAFLAQIKGDVWWNGTASWWLTAHEASQLNEVTYFLASSDFLTNVITHAITAFELLFIIGIWFSVTQTFVARLGLVAWPLIGLAAGEPYWGMAMLIFSLSMARTHRITFPKALSVLFH